MFGRRTFGAPAPRRTPVPPRPLLAPLTAASAAARAPPVWQRPSHDVPEPQPRLREISVARLREIASTEGLPVQEELELRAVPVTAAERAEAERSVRALVTERPGRVAQYLMAPPPTHAPPPDEREPPLAMRDDDNGPVDPTAALGNTQFARRVRRSAACREVRLVFAPKDLVPPGERPTLPLSTWVALMVRAGLADLRDQRRVAGDALTLTGAFCDPPEELTAEQTAAREAIAAMALSHAQDERDERAAAVDAIVQAQRDLAEVNDRTFPSLLEDRVRVVIVLIHRPAPAHRGRQLPMDRDSLSKLGTGERTPETDPPFVWSSYSFIQL